MKNFKHHLYHTRFYSIYRKMRERTGNKNHIAFKDYGGKGINCDWITIENFRDDMFKSYEFHVKQFGEKDTTLDRIDGTKGYNKQNCRWITRKEQQQNRKDNIIIEFKGQQKTLSQWADYLGIKYRTIQSRYYKNWPLEKLLMKGLYGKI